MIPPEIAFDEFVEPARAEYREAEKGLTSAALGETEAPEIEGPRQLVLRRARTAAVELHQFADRVHSAAPSWAPVGSLPELRAWLQEEHCRFLRSETPVPDVDLLQDLADAFKHVRLSHPPKGRSRVVTQEGAVIRLATLAWLRRGQVWRSGAAHRGARRRAAEGGLFGAPERPERLDAAHGPRRGLGAGLKRKGRPSRSDLPFPLALLRRNEAPDEVRS